MEKEKWLQAPSFEEIKNRMIKFDPNYFRNNIECRPDPNPSDEEKARIEAKQKKQRDLYEHPGRKYLMNKSFD